MRAAPVFCKIPMRVLISSGEASGDTYGALLIEALKKRVPQIEAYGVGGEKMRAAGFRAAVEARDVAVVGLAEVVSHLPKIYGRYKALLRELDGNKPDAAVLIDFPDWNLRLARELHKRGVPVTYYVSPQLWAWRPDRIEQIKRYVKKLLVIFPFEQEWYRQRGVEAEYVGHPLADVPAPTPPHQRSPQVPIAILPGSRQKEITMNLPAMLQAAQQLGKEYQFFIPVASTISGKWIIDFINRAQGETAGVNLKLETDARTTLKMARAAMVASGTATVEAALLGTPFVMVYRVASLTWKMGRRMVKVPFFAMPNLIAGRKVVPELVQAEFTAERLASEMRKIIVDGPERQEMLNGLAEVRAKLASPGPGTAS